jgi:hypothetical protein
MKKEKQIGLRKCLDDPLMPSPEAILEADRWLETVQRIRGTKRVCKRGLYKFETFEEADEWMEAMILNSQESRP